MTDAQARQLNPVVLAFVGDAVYSLYVRERLVCSSQGKAAEYQRAASKIVSAEGQSVFLAQIEPILDETEMEIFKRGRNAKKATKSKNASAAAYNRSTGFEAVLGYLYLTGDEERLRWLLGQITADTLGLAPAKTPYKP